MWMHALRLLGSPSAYLYGLLAVSGHVCGEWVRKRLKWMLRVDRRKTTRYQLINMWFESGRELINNWIDLWIG